ncbi:zinc finger BED domain-containing protein [Pungitius pungitius]|uniref:zinc finger BED domain-containing protein n=1 Tax=Pungitius pungitius TaxID=134920 RepID=UPI00188866F9|nr:zinc finger BED domain-containing protein [Pungitius pungitius]XP_037308874.1 zinc finger BED domain-containing protein [Pungitius pungitius]XP_037308885.1 zinc finger BED domain-containing protein [Pungitius pungitius]XP_037308896.1 zinc finger BED domain-containing protein [Pungitius pungitius]
MLNEAGIISAIDGIPDGVQRRPVAGRYQEASDGRPVKRKRNKRSLIWRHYVELDSFAAARCCICMKVQSIEGGSTSNLHRHMSNRHPEVFSQLAADRRHPPPTHSPHISDANVEVVLEDEDSDTLDSAMNGIRECTQEDPAEEMTHEEASDDNPVKRRRSKRSLIWRHYEQLDHLAAARCRICMKKLQYFEGGSTSNLHRHMSKRHPEMFSQLLADGQPPPTPHSSHSSGVNGDTFMPPKNAGATEKPRQFSGLLKVSKASVGEKFVLRRERELIEALRAAQREEARALEHQRELLEKLRAMNAREAAAEREQIESLRTAQLEEAKDLSRQREEVQKEKSELLKKLEELQRERQELV